VDLFWAERVICGERWDFDLLASKCNLIYRETGDGDASTIDYCPFLNESITLDRQRHHNAGNKIDDCQIMIHLA